MVTLPINHLKRTLDRCCGQWEFVDDPEPNTFKVCFLNTRKEYVINFDDSWVAMDCDTVARCPRLSNLLNGHKRNDAGNVELPSDFDCLPEVPQ